MSVNWLSLMWRPLGAENHEDPLSICVLCLQGHFQGSSCIFNRKEPSLLEVFLNRNRSVPGQFLMCVDVKATHIHTVEMHSESSLFPIHRGIAIDTLLCWNGQNTMNLPAHSSVRQSPQSVSHLRLFHFSLKMDQLQSPNGLEKDCDQCEMVLV